MNYPFEIMETRDRNFYCTLGEFFSSPEVRKELPYLKDEYNRKWLVVFATEKKEKIVAVASYAVTKKKVLRLQSAYVYPKFRNKGLYEFLIDTRLKFGKKDGARKARTITKSPIVISLMKKKGFKITNSKINYKTMEYQF